MGEALFNRASHTDSYLHQYDPIVGVVPHSMKELWQQQEQDRNELYEQLCYTQRIQSLPPVSYSVEYENNARDKATSSSQEITPPNTLS